MDARSRSLPPSNPFWSTTTRASWNLLRMRPEDLPDLHEVESSSSRGRQPISGDGVQRLESCRIREESSALAEQGSGGDLLHATSTSKLDRPGRERSSSVGRCFKGFAVRRPTSGNKRSDGVLPSEMGLRDAGVGKGMREGDQGLERELEREYSRR